ncbi:MAG: iron-siderophore ABC transporter substrate-binding protein [Actinomycetota bacterium]
MKKLLLALLVVGLVAAACGGSDDDGDAVSSASDVATTSTTDAPSSASEPSGSDVADSTTSVAETTTTAAPSTRVVEHAFGTAEVPGVTERIVVMDPGTILPTLLFLGVDSIVAAPLPEEPFPTTLVTEDDLAGIATVGLPEVSFELVAAAQPDVIIGFDLGLQESYDQLSQIAPTVAVELDLNDWRGTGERVAAALGLEVEMAEALADYDERVATLQASIGDPSAIDVSIARALGQVIRLHTKFHFAGQVLDDVGFGRPDSQTTDDPETRLVQVSLEELPMADADHLFVFGAGQFGSLGGDGVSEVVQEILDHPLYPTLGVAETGNVHVVDPLGWQQGGLPAANLILDDLEGVFS